MSDLNTEHDDATAADGRWMKASQISAWRLWPQWAKGLVTFVLTALALTAWQHVFDRLVPTFDDGWALYWPHNGIVAGVLLCVRRRWWRWILAGFVCAFAVNELHAHDPLSETTVVNLSNLGEILVAAYMLPRFRLLNKWLMQPGLVLRFTLFVVLVPAATGMFVAAYFVLDRHAAFWENVLLWSAADALGAALWLPLILVLLSRETYELFRWRKLPETVALFLCLGLLTWLTFHQRQFSIGFLPFPLLLLIAMRLGFSGAVIGANMVILIVASLSEHGFGIYGTSSGLSLLGRATMVQVFGLIAILFVLPLSVTLAERRNFQLQLELALEEMKDLASTDKLTQLANRRHFDHALETEWKRAVRTRTPVGLLMIDADYFKAFNDFYGHVAGDECLRRIAAFLAEGPLRQHDVLARYGGEEFALLLPGASETALAAFAEKLRRTVHEGCIPHEKNPVGCVTVSVGCAALIPPRQAPPEILIEAADRALYKAKQAGRNRVELAVHT